VTAIQAGAHDAIHHLVDAAVAAGCNDQVGAVSYRPFSQLDAMTGPLRDQGFTLNPCGFQRGFRFRTTAPCIPAVSVGVEIILVGMTSF
jgi:hypothetical protein